jgi:soluble lytic murein transglycosylase
VESIAGYLTSRTDLGPDASRGLARTLVSEAHAHGFEPALVLGLIQVESTFRPDVVSSAGAVGLMQIRPVTGRYLAEQLGMPWAGRQTLLDPEANVRLGIAYLAELRDGFGNLGAALAAYNWGPSRIRSRLVRGAGVPQGYARRVLDAYADHAPGLGAAS